MIKDAVLRTALLCLSLFLFICATSFSFAQIGGKAGAYSRMGFGARGMAMGNALTAVTSGDATSYYNPATIPFAEYRSATLSFGILSFDRRLNFLGFTQPLGGGETMVNDTVRRSPRAGISFGIINSGVSNIDGRDSDGEPTGSLQTSENQAFLGFATQLKNGFAIGVNVKFLYHHLYTNVNSTTFGIDAGLLYPVNEHLTIGAAAKDFISKYAWNTNTIYGENGTQVDDTFPQLYSIGACYKLPNALGIVALDAQFSNQSTFTLKFGSEVSLLKTELREPDTQGFVLQPELLVRAGIDRIDVKEKGTGIRPTFGFSLRQSFDNLTPALNYAFVLEPFATSGMHMISLSMVF
jgi:hypothetical protein